MSRFLPSLPYEDWEATKATLHLTCQIIGKVKLARHPKLPHWWHTTLRVTPRGISTHTIPVPGGSFELEIDVHDLRLVVRTSEGHVRGFDLAGCTVADVHRQTHALLDEVGHPTAIRSEPYDCPHSDVPFPENDHASWDHQAILRWWRAMTFIQEAFSRFAGQTFLRTSPVQLYWHSFDIAVTLFTGRRSPAFGQGGRRSDVEAYSHEVISFGWWPGDPKVRFPAFYSYTAPEPDGLASHPLQPDAAWWQELESSHMAMLKWEDVCGADDPHQAVMAFLQSAYTAGAAALAAGGHVLDPDLLRTEPLWDDLDERFPATRGRENR